MVLALIISLFFFQSAPIDGLTQRYQKEITRSIKKSFEMDSPYLSKINYSNGELHAIKDESGTNGFVLVSEVAACNLGGCSAFDKIKSQGAREYFDLLLITDTEGQIKVIKILDYFSDYGYEITSKKYLKKFVGKNTCDFALKTDDVDAISGATISSYALEGVLELFCSNFDTPKN